MPVEERPRAASLVSFCRADPIILFSPLLSYNRCYNLSKAREFLLKVLKSDVIIIVNL